MKRFTLSFIILAVLFGGNVLAQTYGLFAEKDIYKLDGDFFSDFPRANIMFDTGEERFWKVGSDSSYFGEEALRIIFDVEDDNPRVGFHPDSLFDDAAVDLSEFNDGDLAFHIKLVEPCDVAISVSAWRNGGGVDESNEYLSWWGLDTTNISTWQKIYVVPTGIEGNIFDFAGYNYIALRNQAFYANVIWDEVYMVYGLLEYGLYADSADFTGEGSMELELGTEEGASYETVPGFSGDGLHITLDGNTNDDRVNFYPNADHMASYPRWNDALANLVFYIKLNKPIQNEGDLHLEVSALRNGEELNGSDEPLVRHGLNKQDTLNWQRIVIDLADGLEGDSFDYTQFEKFALRSRTEDGTPTDFIVDEMYVRYPETPTSDVSSKGTSIPGTFALEQNYPNPFNPITRIAFNLSKPAMTRLTVYNVFGQEVAELVNRHMTAGRYEVPFDAGNLPTGTYFYKLQSGDVSQVQKMLLIK